MTADERYRMPTGYGEAEYIEKRSRFLGKVWQIASEEEALAHIVACREQYWDASHNVYCYRVRNGGIMRYSDDGEPGGTAGMPTLNVFQSQKLENYCCVVTRYFGGTLLGAGGLVRAYSHTAKLSLDAAGLSEARLWQRLLVGCSYSLYERLRQEIELLGGTVEDSDFGADVTVTAMFHAEEAERVTERLTDVSAGTAVIEPVSREFRALPLLRKDC